MKTLILILSLTQLPAWADDLTAPDTAAVNFVARKPSSLEVAELKAASAPQPKIPLKPELADNETEASVCTVDCSLNFHSTQPLHAGLTPLPIHLISK